MMQALAAYVLRGQWQAISLAISLALVSWLLLPLSWPASFVSGAVVTLMTLVKGPRQGSITAIGAALGMTLLFSLASQLPVQGLAFAAMVWLPALVGGVVLLRTTSLALSILAIAGLAVLVIVAIYITAEQPAAWWFRYFTEVVVPQLKAAGMNPPDDELFRQQLALAARIMTGMIVAVAYAGALASILIARSWQAQLFRPGAYSLEFRQLHFGRMAGLLIVMMILFAIFTRGVFAEIVMNVLPVAVMVFLLQGLSLIHAKLTGNSNRGMWLGIMYAALIVTMPYLIIFVATIGLLDSWLKLPRNSVTSV